MKKQSLSLTACLLLCLGGPTALQAQSKAFSYQGRLTDNGVPANGQYRMRFRLFAELQPEGGQGLAASTQSVSVVNGLFTARPEFIGSPEIFDGDDRWLEIGVAGIDNPDLFTALVPRQNITRTPYALYSATAGGPVEGVPWNFSDKVMFNAASGPPFSILSSTKVAGLNVDLLDGLDSSAFWKLTGNSGTTPGANFLGTADNQALELKVNNSRGLRIEPVSRSSGGFNPTTSRGINLTGGSSSNQILPGVIAGTVGGGGSASSSLLGSSSSPNKVTDDYGTIGGGSDNQAGNGTGAVTDAIYATVSGGEGNTASAAHTTIGGGHENLIQNNADYATIGGGHDNMIEADIANSTIAGGSANHIFGDSFGSPGSATISGGVSNQIGSFSIYATIGGGHGNTIISDSFGTGTYGDYATVPGGRNNAASGDYSLAAGRRAKANHNGSFVWADSVNANFASSANNEFNVRASGGVRLFSNAGATTGVRLAPGSGTWSSLSDRAAKTNVIAADGRQILERLTAIPIATWNYKSQDSSIRHMGPMAQDFAAAFGVGEDDQHITTVDADGVALAAIQGLNEKFEDALKQKDAEVGELKTRLHSLEKILHTLATK